jgi:hypothetical protein
MVRMDAAPWSFICRTASTGSWETSWVFGHASGSLRVLEKTTLGTPRQGIHPRFTGGGHPRHEPIGVGAHQDRGGRFGLIFQPCEALRPFEAPKAGSARSRPVAVERGDEVNEQVWHLRFSCASPALLLRFS